MSQVNGKDDILTLFMQTVNCDGDIAHTYLEFCDWNLETAIDRFCATNGDISTLNPQTTNQNFQQFHSNDQYKGDSNNNNSYNNMNIDGDNDIRIPDTAYHEQLVPQQFFGNLIQQQTDSLKNFGRQWQTNSKSSKAYYLSNLFSEPEYRFEGTLDDAKIKACEKNRWLLVNIQSSESFISHCLNRDIWKNKEFSNIIKSAFILYQHEQTTSNGHHFINLYNIVTIPHICIVDPNTGRKEKEIHVPESLQNLESIKNEIIDFLDKYPNPKQKPKSTLVQPIPSSVQPEVSNDDEELKRALLMSLDENENENDNIPDINNQVSNVNDNNNNNNNNNNNKNNTNNFEYKNNDNYSQNIIENKNENNNDTKKSNKKLEEEPEEKDPNATAIRVRLPNGSIIQRRFNKNAKIEDLYTWISINENRDKITLSQPMPTLILNDKKNQTLKQMGLIKALLNCSYDD